MNAVSYSSQNQGRSQATQGEQPSTTGSIHYREAKSRARPVNAARPESNHASDDAVLRGQHLDDTNDFAANHPTPNYFTPTAAARARSPTPTPVPSVHGSPSRPASSPDPGFFSGAPEKQPNGQPFQHDLSVEVIPKSFVLSNLIVAGRTWSPNTFQRNLSNLDVFFLASFSLFITGRWEFHRIRTIT